MFKQAIVIWFCFLPGLAFAQSDTLRAVSTDSGSDTVVLGKSRVLIFMEGAERKEWVRILRQDTLMINLFRRQSPTGECEIRIGEMTKISPMGYDLIIHFYQVYPPGTDRPVFRGIGRTHFLIAIDNVNLKEASRILAISRRFSEI